MKIWRLATTLALAASALVLAPAAASAAPHVPNGAVEELDLPAGLYCSFPIHVETVSAQAPRPDLPSTIVTGAYAITVTNADTSASATYNASGPAIGSKQVGLWLLGQPSTSSPNTFLIITAGQPTFNGDGTLASQHGHVLHDICAELA